VLFARVQVGGVKGLVQRVERAAVTVEGQCVGSIEQGLLALVGVGHDDTERDAELLADRMVGLRVFADREGKMNLALGDIGGALLVVSQFTLMGDTRRGRRPSFVQAAAPERAAALIERVVEKARGLGVEVSTGRFGAHMHIDLRADGPVTLMLDTREPRSDA
jgi:D-tyrosyl-tRNA(Tyr) deacylase